MKSKKSIFSIAFILAVGAFVCYLVICLTEAGREYKATFFSMDTVMEITAYGKNAKSAISAATERISEIEKEMSVNDEGSDTYRINHSGGETVFVSEDTLLVLDKAITVSQMSDGALDITVFPVVQKWGFTTGNYGIPEKEEITSLLKSVDYKKIRIDESGAVITEEGMQVDFGALAKGSAADEAAKVLRENGVKSALLNLGGNICVVGTKPDGTDWNIAVKNPLSDGEYAGVLSISDKCAVTSGSYERFFEGADGEHYHHIIDPHTGYPADSDFVSVTVVCEEGLYADALSTALFVAGYERAADIWRTANDFEFVGILKDGSVVYTEGLKECFYTELFAICVEK